MLMTNGEENLTSSMPKQGSKLNMGKQADSQRIFENNQAFVKYTVQINSTYNKSTYFDLLEHQHQFFF